MLFQLDCTVTVLKSLFSENVFGGQTILILKYRMADDWKASAKISLTQTFPKLYFQASSTRT
jgi:hypothetical protein